MPAIKDASEDASIKDAPAIPRQTVADMRRIAASFRAGKKMKTSDEVLAKLRPR